MGKVNEEQVRVAGIDFKNDLFEPTDEDADMNEHIRKAFYEPESFFDKEKNLFLHFLIFINPLRDKFIVGFRRALGCSCHMAASDFPFTTYDPETMSGKNGESWGKFEGAVNKIKELITVKINNLDVPTGDFEFYENCGFPTREIPNETRQEITDAVTIGVKKLLQKIS